jgi:hypothetical protein
MSHGSSQHQHPRRGREEFKPSVGVPAASRASAVKQSVKSKNRGEALGSKNTAGQKSKHPDDAMDIATGGLQ